MTCACGHGAPHEVEAHGIELDPLPPRRPMIRANITDKAALSAVKPAAVVAYLDAHGWTKIDPPALGAMTCSYYAIGDHEVLVPLRLGWAEYASHVVDLIAYVAVVEDRSQLDILVDMGGSIYAPAPPTGSPNHDQPALVAGRTSHTAKE